MNANTWLCDLPADHIPHEADAKRLLANYGVMTPQGVVLDPGNIGGELGSWSPEFPGPYVVKVVSGRLLHKTEAGAVRIDVSVEDLGTVVNEFTVRFPGESILVEQMVKAEPFEFIVGAFRDRALGPAVMCGAGGTLTELYDDVSFRLIPCSSDEIGRMIDELHVASLLRGYRQIRLDRVALVSTIATMCSLVEDLADKFQELDVNPIVFNGKAWVALDAKIVLSRAEMEVALG